MSVKEEILNLPKFEDNKVSTRTYIARCNIKMDLLILFKKLPITEYVVKTKKRGRKKKIEEMNPNLHIKPGSIITLKYNIDNKSVLRGVNISKNNNKSFRNCMTIVIMCKDNKKINFKVCANGTIQMTGCREKEHAIEVLEYFWGYIKNIRNEIYDKSAIINSNTFKPLEFILVPSMRNIDFSLGFNVNRESLSNIIRDMPEDDYRSMLEPSFGYTGGNIKLEDDIIFLVIDKITFLENDKYNIEKITYNDYLNVLVEKERIKKLEQERYNTFLVFHSGKIIMSGISEELMETTYYKFLDIIRKYYKEIKETLD